MPASKQLAGRLGAQISWSHTVDRTERTSHARRAGPGQDNYWIGKLDPVKFADATDEQKAKAAEAAKRAFYTRLSLKAQQARAAKRKGPANEQKAKAAEEAEREETSHARAS